MNETKNYKILIFGDEYSLLSDESEQHITESAALVDSLMKEIANKVSIKDPKKVAVLAALQVASRFMKLEKDAVARETKEADLVAKLDRFLGPVSPESF